MEIVTLKSSEWLDLALSCVLVPGPLCGRGLGTGLIAHMTLTQPARLQVSFKTNMERDVGMAVPKTQM